MIERILRPLGLWHVTARAQRAPPPGPRDIGYDAFLTIALEPPTENASATAEKSLAYLRSLLA